MQRAAFNPVVHFNEDEQTPVPNTDFRFRDMSFSSAHDALDSYIEEFEHGTPLKCLSQSIADLFVPPGSVPRSSIANCRLRFTEARAPRGHRVAARFDDVSSRERRLNDNASACLIDYIKRQTANPHIKNGGRLSQATTERIALQNLLKISPDNARPSARFPPTRRRDNASRQLQQCITPDWVTQLVTSPSPSVHSTPARKLRIEDLTQGTPRMRQVRRSESVRAPTQRIPRYAPNHRRSLSERAAIDAAKHSVQFADDTLVNDSSFRETERLIRRSQDYEQKADSSDLVWRLMNTLEGRSSEVPVPEQGDLPLAESSAADLSLGNLVPGDVGPAVMNGFSSHHEKRKTENKESVASLLARSDELIARGSFASGTNTSGPRASQPHANVSDVTAQTPAQAWKSPRSKPALKTKASSEGSLETMKNMLFRMQGVAGRDSDVTKASVRQAKSPSLDVYDFAREPGGAALKKALGHLDRLKTLVKTRQA